jgi:hypothetical protein
VTHNGRALAVPMIMNESEEEWADRINNTVAVIATALMIWIFFYAFLTPLIFGNHSELHATVHY